MKKRLLSLLLMFALLLSGSALAAPFANSTENFIRIRLYTNEFSDVEKGSPFYDNVAALYEYGLTEGKGYRSYAPQDPMSAGEIVIFAGRIRSVFATGDTEWGSDDYRVEGEPPYLAYLRYLQAEGVLGYELDGDCAAGRPATRAQTAHVLANLLPEKALPLLHKDVVTEGYATRQYIADVTEYTAYYDDILKLYTCGVSIGSDARGTFWPEAVLTRGAAAALLTRMVDPALRVTPLWVPLPEHSVAGIRLADLIPPGRYVIAPKTTREWDLVIRDMLARDDNVIELDYDGMDAIAAHTVMERALAAVKVYCEQCYNAVTCHYNSSGDITLTFGASLEEKPIQAYRDMTMVRAAAVHDQLWSEGRITAEMSEYEKARVYYTWICEQCVYDYAEEPASLSHIAYSLFEKGIAVCDGYTGAYNLLMKLEGIECRALSNSDHIWTVATLDGVEYHIDTTWGDSANAINYQYFAMTEGQSREYHAW